jgi:hypothetical protein
MGLNSTRNLSAKLIRWSLIIADFQFKLKHKAGKIHLNADGLTRAATDAPVHDPEAPAIDALEDNLDSDSDLSSIENFDINLAHEVC